MFIETQILGDKERRNKIIRFGFEEQEEAVKALGCIGVGEALYFERFGPNEKTGRLTLPLPGGPIVCKADTLHTIISEVQKRSRRFQLLPENDESQGFLGLHMSYTLWQILRAVNSSEIRHQVCQGILPINYLEKIDDAMHLMRAIGAGKKIGFAAIRQIMDEPRTRPVNLPKAVVYYEEMDRFSSHFPLNVRTVVATSYID